MVKMQIRRYKVYSWSELSRLRDSLQVFCDTAISNSREWGVVDDLLAEIDEEVDYRYKHNRKEG